MKDGMALATALITVASGTGGVLVIGGESRDLLGEVGRDGKRDAFSELGGKRRIGGGPSIVGCLPGFELSLRGSLFLSEEGADLVGHVEVLGWKSETGAGGVDELRSTFAVGLGGAGDFRDALADDGLGDDDLRLAVLGGLRCGDGTGDGGEVVAIDGHGVPALRGEVLLGIFAPG
jgi:hypothetical protein